MLIHLQLVHEIYIPALRECLFVFLYPLFKALEMGVDSLAAEELMMGFWLTKRI